MIDFEEIKKYLPQYLSTTLQDRLFDELKKFPQNIDQRIYSTYLAKNETIYQGDGIEGLMVVNLPDPTIKPASSMVLSNICDIYSFHVRYFPSRIVYAPIFNLEKYKRTITNEFEIDPDVTLDKIEDHIKAIKRQFVTQIFYLPKGARLQQDSIVFLDRLNNCPVESLSAEKIKERKIFTLSDYGFYLFLIKLSIHFTRVREELERKIPEC